MKHVLNHTLGLVLLLLAGLFMSPVLWADEGMWLLGQLDKRTLKEMKREGLRLKPRELYNPQGLSLKDAVVSFGGFCSGVVVSSDGLVLTNHHCGSESVQFHSTEAHDYLRDGFVARTRAEELPNHDLYVRFLCRQEDVTKRVLSGVTPTMNEQERSQAIDSISLAISQEISATDSTLVGVVDACYSGNAFLLSVYRDYSDVRLVFAPPSSVGKFGWDNDNWEWPRHTGDFCVFRIYADSLNRPAPYDPSNVPYHPQVVAPISLDGYRPGTFCMTLGYPGSTERYLSSYGIEQAIEGQHEAQITIRGIKQSLWKEAMNRNQQLRISYAAKYDQSSNYWKNSIGTVRSIRKLHLLEQKRAREQQLKEWIRTQPAEREQLLHLFTNLEQYYSQTRRSSRAFAYLVECFFNGSELVQLAFDVLNLDTEAEEHVVADNLLKLLRKYNDYCEPLDRRVTKALMTAYRERVDAEFLPPCYQTIDTDYQGNVDAYVDSLFNQTKLTSTEGLRRAMENDSTYQIYQDPAIGLCIDLLSQMFEIRSLSGDALAEIARCERQLDAALRRMDDGGHHYPDANGTLRLSYGTIGGYDPYDGATYDYFTTPLGIFEKICNHPGNPDYQVQPELLDLFQQGDFGRYADRDGQMHLCFLSNNDITGGNSGSAMFNGRGELLGLAFDGNWEAMSSDLRYEPRLQRTIGVDVRYILFIIEQYGKAAHLVEEMQLISTSQGR